MTIGSIPTNDGKHFVCELAWLVIWLSSSSDTTMMLVVVVLV